MGFLFGESLAPNEPFTSSLSVSGLGVQPRQKEGGQGPAHNREFVQGKELLPALLARRVRQGPSRGLTKPHRSFHATLEINLTL